MNHVVSRRLRAGLLLALTAVSLSACGSDERSETLGFEDGVAPAGDGLTLLEGVLLYFLAPLAILLAVAALVWLPGMVRGTRYRPGRGWGAAPLWFGGPPDPAAAVEVAETGEMNRGGASGSW